MVTRVIPHDEWAEYLDDLSDSDETVLVTLEMLGGELGDQIVARDQPLTGLTLVEKGSDAGEIEIMLGDGAANHFSQVIAAPTRVSVLETEEGLPQTLQIEAEGATTFLLHFQETAEEDLLEDEDEEE